MSCREWKPKIGDRYYTPYCSDDKKFKVHIWKNDEVDNFFYKNISIFKTKHEAIKESKYMISEMLSVKEEE